MTGYTLTTQEEMGNATVLVNSHTPELVTTTVVKIWDDDNNAAGLRPAILRVTLSNAGTYYLTPENGWTVTVTDLPRYRGNGNPIRYEWSEQSVLGYTSSVTVNEYTTIFTNSHREEKPPVPHNRNTTIEDLPTPLSMDVMINHVGDCFD